MEEKQKKCSLVLNSIPIALRVQIQLKQLFLAAERLLFRKIDKHGVFRTFTASRLEDFLENYGSIQQLFPASERLLIMEYLLKSTLADNSSFPGCKFKETLVQWLQRRNYLLSIFPLHNEEYIKRAKRELSLWNLLSSQSSMIDNWRTYFGDKIALYFTFHLFYLKMILPLALIGCLVWYLEDILVDYATRIGACFCFCAVFWSVFFLELWKRRNAAICHQWSFIEMGEAQDMVQEWREDTRSDFYGDIGVDAVTGESVLMYPKHKKICRIVFSWFTVVFMLSLSVWIMFAFASWEQDIHWALTDTKQVEERIWLKEVMFPQIPTVLYVTIVYILEYVYTHVADTLTKLENHKTQTQFENHQVAKLVIFQFFNMNMSLLYLAFFEMDFSRLRSSLSSFQILNVTAMNIIETVVHILGSYLLRRQFSFLHSKHVKKMKKTRFPGDADAIRQYYLPTYSGVFVQYLELMRQFSHIILFSAAFPLGAALSMFSGFIEIYWEVFKLTRLTRRPFPQREVTIGSWYFAFEAISVASVMTNLGIVFITNGDVPKLFGRELTVTGRLFLAVILEHILVAIRFLVAVGIDDIPEWVRIAHLRNTHALSKELDEAEIQLYQMHSSK
eukprot:jgi/Galph1/1331/GphlegSOOS_G6012.1